MVTGVLVEGETRDVRFAKERRRSRDLDAQGRSEPRRRGAGHRPPRQDERGGLDPASRRPWAADVEHVTPPSPAGDGRGAGRELEDEPDGGPTDSARATAERGAVAGTL